MKNEKTIDLDNPKDAKKFLRGVRIQGKAIDFVIINDDQKLHVEEMNDEQLVRYAKDVYFDFCGGVEGEPGQIDLEGIDQ